MTIPQRTGTVFLIALQKTPDAALRKALNSRKALDALADKYGQKVAWVAFEINHWLGRAA